MQKNLRRSPFYLVSLMNALLLVIVTMLAAISAAGGGEPQRVDAMRGLIAVEVLINCSCWVYYLRLVTAHNKQRPLPDIEVQQARERMLLDLEHEEMHDVLGRADDNAKDGVRRYFLCSEKEISSRTDC